MEKATENSSVLETVESKYFDLEALPREILLLIISYIPTKTLIAMRSLSHFWKEFIQNSGTILREFEFLRDGTTAGDDTVAYFEKKAPEIVCMELVARHWSAKKWYEIYFSLPRFLAYYGPMKYKVMERKKRNSSDLPNTRQNFTFLDFKKVAYWVTQQILDDEPDFIWAALIFLAVNTRDLTTGRESLDIWGEIAWRGDKMGASRTRVCLGW